MAVDIQSEVLTEPPFRRHFINMAVPLLISLAMILPFVLIAAILSIMGLTVLPSVRAGLWLFGGGYTIFIVSFFMMQWIFWYLDAWFITQQRLIDIQLVTLFNRRVAQIPFNQIQDVRVTIQGSLASIFRFGDITVQSAGKEGFFHLKSIPNARELANRISELSEESQENLPRATVDRITRPTQQLGDILVNQGVLSPSNLMSALQDQHQSGRRLGQILLERQLISREDLVHALGNQYRMPSIDLSRYQLEPEVVREMPYDTAAKFIAIPVARSPETLTVAIAEPSPEKIGELASQFDIPLAFMVADEDYIREAITGHYLVGQETLIEPTEESQQVKDVLPE